MTDGLTFIDFCQLTSYQVLEDMRQLWAHSEVTNHLSADERVAAFLQLANRESFFSPRDPCDLQQRKNPATGAPEKAGDMIRFPEKGDLDSMLAEAERLLQSFV